MTPDQIELMKGCARMLLAHHEVGRICDPERLEWARKLLAQNPGPTPTVPYDDDLPPPWDKA